MRPQDLIRWLANVPDGGEVKFVNRSGDTIALVVFDPEDPHDPYESGPIYPQGEYSR